MNYFKSSVGRKQIMGITGLGLSLFVLTHMAGNMLILLGPKAYNAYSHVLITSKLVYVAEAGLLALFLAHFILGVRLARENRAARPERYAQTVKNDKGVSFASKTMIFHGLILLVFTVHHIITFKYGPYYSATYDGVEMRDLHRLVIEVFHMPAYVIWYVFCLIGLGLHLSHGFSSSFQSIGINHPRYTPWIKRFGFLYAVVVSLGFISQPLYVYFLI